MNTIIFSLSVSGHHLEYLHHIYDVCKKRTESRYIFVVPYEYNVVKDKFNWSKAENITFDFILDEELKYYRSQSGIINPGKAVCSIINRKAKENNVSSVFSIVLGWTGIFAPLYLDRNIKLSGIIYDIYAYALAALNSKGRLVYRIQHLLMSKSKCYDKLLILNDKRTADQLNSKFSTHKYRYVPDPIIPINPSGMNLRHEYGIAENQVVFSHFGGLSERKGTLELLSAIGKMNDEALAKSVFIIAGRVYNDIKERFYQEIQLLKYKANIIVEDKFCEYNYFADLCMASNYVVLPYLSGTRSSGIIGYAAQFGTPVIATQSSFLGELVMGYNLGLLIPKVDSCILKMVLEKSVFEVTPQTHSLYVSTHRLEDFQKVINESI